MTTLVNPYIAGSPVSGAEMFFGREDVFDFVSQTLTGRHRDQVIVLYGQRRTGKTSVLYQMHRHLSPSYLCIFVDLHGLALNGLDGFLWDLANHIRRALRREYALELPRMDKTDFLSDPRNNFEEVFLNQVWAVAGDKHLLLMMDEAVRLQEQVQAGKLEHEIFEYLRHLMQHTDRLNFLFSIGSGLEEMEKEYALLFNVALYKKISFLDEAAAVALVTDPVKEHYHLSTAAINHLLAITSRHPYFTQLICHSLFNQWQREQVPTLTVADVDATLDEVVERGLAVLKFVWEESKPAERAILAGMSTAMGENNRPVSAKDIANAWAKLNVTIPRSDMVTAIRALIARDVITGDDRYRFTVDLQHRWIRQYERLEWVEEEIAATIVEWDRQLEEEKQLRPIATPPLTSGLPLRSWLFRFGLALGGVVVVIALFLIIQEVISGRSTSQPPSDTPTNGQSGQGLSVAPGGDTMLINDLAVAGDIIWAATDGGLVRWTMDGRGERVPGDDLGFPDDCVNAIDVAADESIWIGCGGVAQIMPSGDRLTLQGYYDRDGGLNMGVINSLLVDGDGQTVWAGGEPADSLDTNLSHFIDGEWFGDELPFYDPVLEGLDLSINSMLRDSVGSLWLGLEQDGLLRWDGETWHHFGPEVGLGGTGQGDFRVRRLLQDPQGDLTDPGHGPIWAAASEAGLLRYDFHLSNWERNIVTDEGEVITGISQFDDGSLWAAGTLNDRGFVAQLVGHRGPILSLAIDPTGQRIATTSTDGTVRLWDVTTGEALTVLHHDDVVLTAAFSPDGRQVLTGSVNGSATLWETETGRQLASFDDIGSVWSVAFSPDGSKIAAGGDQGSARLWNAGTGELIAELPGQLDGVIALAFSPDGLRLVTAGNDGIGRVWDAETGELAAILEGHEDRITSAAFSPDGRLILAAGFDGTVRLWQTETGRLTRTIPGPGGRILSASFNPDGRLLITANEDHPPRLYHTDTGEPVAEFGDQDTIAHWAIFSPEGEQVLTVRGDTIRLWETETGAELEVLAGQTNDISQALFTPDGSLIVTASSDGTARIWDRSRGEIVAILGQWSEIGPDQGLGSDIKGLVQTPDGRIWAGAYDGGLSVYDGSQWSHLQR